MAGVSLTTEESELLEALPRCCACNKLLYQLSVSVVLPCTHFLYCGPCFEAVLERDGAVTCNLCGVQYSDVDYEPAFREISEEIHQLYAQEADPSARADALRQIQGKISQVYERYLNPPDSRRSEEQEPPSTRDVLTLPAIDIPDPRREWPFPCEACGAAVPAGEYRCSCGYVDYGAYQSLHNARSARLVAQVAAMFGEGSVDAQSEESVHSSHSEKAEVPPAQPAKPPVQSHANPPAEPPEHPEAIPIGPSTNPMVRLSLAYIKLTEEGGENVSGVGLTPLHRAQPNSRLGEQDEDDGSLRLWAKIAIVLVVLLLIYDVVQVNVDNDA